MNTKTETRELQGEELQEAKLRLVRNNPWLREFFSTKDEAGVARRVERVLEYEKFQDSALTKGVVCAVVKISGTMNFKLIISEHVILHEDIMDITTLGIYLIDSETANLFLNSYADFEKARAESRVWMTAMPDYDQDGPRLHSFMINLNFEKVTRVAVDKAELYFAKFVASKMTEEMRRKCYQ